METKYDYTAGIVNKQDKRRKMFINEMAFYMQQLESTSMDVNDLINWLFCMSDDQHYYPIELSANDIDLEPIKQLDENRIFKEIFEGDFHLYSYVLLLHQFVYSQKEDILSDIIYELYKKLDKIVHPYQFEERDLEDVKYFVELVYEPIEQ